MLHCPPKWTSEATVSTDCTFHQLAPYIGRMKTSMARFFVANYTKPGDVIADPFCGSGVVALEAAIEGRKVIAGDCNPYAVILTKAKLWPPCNAYEAEMQLNALWRISRDNVRSQDLRKVPDWVRKFFHRETLRNALAFRDACVDNKSHFFLACLMGILHHQRPGFLSFPSSHLVPYLRSKKFPRTLFPDMYAERDVYSRLLAKLRRSFRRPPDPYQFSHQVFHCDARSFPLPTAIDAVVTSPPYMNELDYIRDNRLRLWFIERSLPDQRDMRARNREQSYADLMQETCTHIASNVRLGGRIILVVGEAGRGAGAAGNTVDLTQQLFASASCLSDFSLEAVYHDEVPDIRRSRRECRGTKMETVLIYQRQREMRMEHIHGSSKCQA